MKFSSSLFLFLACLSLTVQGQAQASQDSVSYDVMNVEGQNYYPSSFFRERYLHNNFETFIDNYNDFVTYQAETTGDYGMPDQTVFSINGDSYKWNKYYKNGFRINSRILSGHQLYRQDLYKTGFNLDQYNTEIRYYTDEETPDAFTGRYSHGDVGGISPTTKTFINIFHPTATERQYKPFDYRRSMKNSGMIMFDINVGKGDSTLAQHFYADLGQRTLPQFDTTGLSGLYPEDFLKIELQGEVWNKGNNLLDNISYATGYSKRNAFYSEFNYNENETATQEMFNFSIYGSKQKVDRAYTTGFTLSNNNIRHNDLEFSRNAMDLDGEGFEPWYSDNNTLELTHFLNYDRGFKHNLSLNIETYNSWFISKDNSDDFDNFVYAEGVNQDYQSLYIYQFQGNDFMSGLLENTISLSHDYDVNEKFSIHTMAAFTLDAMILNNEKSMVSPNWEADLHLSYQPAKWFQMGLNLSRRRVSYNYEHVKYFSDDYLNGDISYWNDHNGNKAYDPGEKSNQYLTSTGGKYHEAADDLKQQSVATLDIPLIFTFGKHEFAIHNMYKRYGNTWFTNYATDPTFTTQDIDDKKSNDPRQAHFQESGEVQYVVEQFDADLMSDGSTNALNNTPYFVSNNLKYRYTGDRFMLSLAWQSFMQVGYGSMGNGVLHNNVDVLSESTANPNSQYDMIGRLDADRAYVGRIITSYKVTDHLTLSSTFKFKDGQPIAYFNTYFYTNDKGNTQMAMQNQDVKGINPYEEHMGKREDAFFNLDLRASYNNTWKDYRYELNLTCYNIYDFGTELSEYSFAPDDTRTRYAMELNIPRGLMFTGKIYF